MRALDASGPGSILTRVNTFLLGIRFSCHVFCFVSVFVSFFPNYDLITECIAGLNFLLL